MSPATQTAPKLRPAQQADLEPCGRILFDAFFGIATEHNFRPDIPAVEAANAFVEGMIYNPTVFGVVAELDGTPVGSNFLWEGDAIRGVGPISVAPALQGDGIGRRLMQAVIDRGRDAAGVRLVQDTFNCRSMSLYASLGFGVREPLALLEGRPKSGRTLAPGVTVRPYESGDLEACADLCRRVHGFDRSSELRYAGPMVSPWVLERDHRIKAYTTTVHFWPLAHGVAETEDDLKVLLLGAAATSSDPISILLPIRQANLHRWCLAEGLRMIKPMTLMAMGEYIEPRGAWFPSVFY